MIWPDDGRAGTEIGVKRTSHHSPEPFEDSADDPRRQQRITIEWMPDGLVGRVEVGGEYWGAVEWSEKRQAWCIEDAAGECLAHARSIHGQVASKDAAVVLAQEMIVDGRLPSPQRALFIRDRTLEERRQKRQQQPAEIAKREARERARDAQITAMMAVARAESADRQQQPIMEALAETFGFSDPELWKSNAWAMLRPRLIVHQRAVVANLEDELLRTIDRAGKQPFAMYADAAERRERRARRQQQGDKQIARLREKLDRARDVLNALEG